MQIDKKRQARQRQAIKRWRFADEYGSPAKGFGTLWHPTGMGKTFTALNECVTLYLNKKSIRTVLVLVHREKLLKQWESEIKNFIQEHHHSQIIVQTVQYYIKNKIVPSCDLLIVDEVHKFYGDEFFTYVDGTNIKRKHLLCLTASYLDPQGRHVQLDKIAPVIDHVTEQEAISNGWISKYIEYNLKIELTNEERKRYNELCEFIDANLCMFPEDKSFAAAQKCIAGGMKDGTFYTGKQFATAWALHNGFNPDLDTEEQKEINAMWNPGVIIGYAKKVMKGVRERKRFLYTCDSKINTVINLINALEGYKIMSFSESTEFADKIYNILNSQKEHSCVVYHSQLESRPLKDEKGNWVRYGPKAKRANEKKLFGLTTLKRVYTEAFINNKVKVLSTAKTLDEGFDCKDIEVGIISSRTSNFNQQIQRKGRNIRIIPEKPDAVMLIINTYIEGTRDYDILRYAQRKSTNKIYWVSEIEQITFNPRKHESFDDI